MAVISSEELRTELLRRKYTELLSRPDVFPSSQNWNYIIDRKMWRGVGPLLYRKYIIASLTPEEDRVASHVIAIKEFPRYLAALQNTVASEILYSDIESAPKIALALAEKLNLFSTKAINDLIDNGKLQLAIPYLAIFKPEYDESDLTQMKGLVRRLKALPKLGKVEMSKGLFSSSMKYICPEGHINNPECTYCEHSGCGKNIYGLTRDMMQTVEKYNYIVEVLEEMIQHS